MGGRALKRKIQTTDASRRRSQEVDLDAKSLRVNDAKASVPEFYVVAVFQDTFQYVD